MTTHIEHPQGHAPPQEWAETGHASAAEFRAWWAGQEKQPQKRSKFGAKSGKSPDLGDIFFWSALERNTARVLLLQGFQWWLERKSNPPEQGKWLRYEGRTFMFRLRPGTDSERIIRYLPDFETWDDGRYAVVECKGHIDQRAKRNCKLMRQFHPEIPYTVVTVSVLDGMALETMREDRRRGGSGVIANWE